jgi:hypothetical protein
MGDKVLAGSFIDDTSTPQISFSKYVDINLGTTSPVKKQRVALAGRDVISNVDVRRRGSGATVDARAMVIVIRPLGWIITVENNRIDCMCHLNKTRGIKYKEYVIKC